MPVEDVLQREGPRKLLALDGGGIRGLLTIGILESLEAAVRAAAGNPELRLGDAFDYIGGTSTGAVIAAALSLGMSVAELREFYLASGRTMFDKAGIVDYWTRHKYVGAQLTRKLKEVFGESTTLGTDRLRSLLLVVMRNAETDSPWPVSNNPHAKYNARHRDDCNLDIPLWQLVRASTAAPTFFPPERVRIGRMESTFVDGGVTPYNNPAFQLFLMATLEPYALSWPTGEDRMLLVSVGTGDRPVAAMREDELQHWYNVKGVPAALIRATSVEQDILCRTFGRCVSGDPIDSEIGDLHVARTPVSPKLFRYARYNPTITRDALNRLGLPDIDPARLHPLDAIDAMDDLLAVGRAAGKAMVKTEHLAGFFAQ
jgi:hypothetical protein